MSNAIPFEDWLDKQGDDVFLAMCDGHPSTIILVDKTDFAVYKYTNDKAENAKLRDAVMDMYAQIKQTCDICDGDFCFNYDEENDCCRFDTMVDELGIEASE